MWVPFALTAGHPAPKNAPSTGLRTRVGSAQHGGASLTSRGGRMAGESPLQSASCCGAAARSASTLQHHVQHMCSNESSVCRLAAGRQLSNFTYVYVLVRLLLS